MVETTSQQVETNMLTPIYTGTLSESEALEIAQSYQASLGVSVRHIRCRDRRGGWLLLPPEAFSLPRYEEVDIHD